MSRGLVTIRYIATIIAKASITGCIHLLHSSKAFLASDEAIALNFERSPQKAIGS